MAIIRWTWQDNSDNELGFQLCDEYGNVIIDNIPADATSIDENISYVGTYRRKIRAYNADGNSDFSNVAEVVFALNKPTDFQASVDYLTGIVTYNWVGNESGATYQICDENGNVKVDNIAANLNTITEQLTATGTFHRKIRCHTIEGYSDFSSVVDIYFTLDIPTNFQVSFDPQTLKATYTWQGSQAGVKYQILDENNNIKVDNIGPDVFTIAENIAGQGAGTKTRKIRATTNGFSSFPSSTVTFTYIIVAPTNLSVSFEGLKAIYTWTDNSPNETGFKICDENGNVKVTVNANMTSAEEILPSGGRYTRKIKSFNADGESTFSDSITFKLAEIVSTRDIATAAPNYIMITPDEVLNGGDIQYFASRDDGNTWIQCIKNIEQILSSQPVDVNIRMRAVIYENAILNGWSYSWR